MSNDVETEEIEAVVERFQTEPDKSQWILLPVGRVLKESFTFVFSNFKPFLQIAFIPFLLVILVGFLRTRYGRIPGNWALDMAQLPESVRWEEVSSVFPVVPFIIFSVAWHRYSISKDYAPKGWINFRITKDEILFLIYGILLGFGAFIPSAILITVIIKGMEVVVVDWSIFPLYTGIGTFVMIGLVGVAAIYWLGRYSLVLPATAVGIRSGFKLSRKISKRNGWRIVIAYVTIIAVFQPYFYLYGVYIEPIWEQLFPSQHFLIGDLLFLINTTLTIPVSFISTAIPVTCLSLIYKYLIVNDPEAASAAQE